MTTEIRHVMWFVMKKANDETICTTSKEEHAVWVLNNYPEPCKVVKVEA